MALAAAIGAPCTVLAKEATKVSAPQATLLGRAIVPANTFLPGPTSGQFLGSKPINGVLPPFRNKQPVQGFSAMVSDGKTGVWVLGDNGFGKAGNSADARLRVYHLQPDWSGRGRPGRVAVLETFDLRDPQRQLPYPLANPDDPERYLSGADLDTESFQRMPDGSWWIGDELGPFLVHVDSHGVVLAPPVPLPVDGLSGPEVRSPDYPPERYPSSASHANHSPTPLTSNRIPPAIIRTRFSGGFEGMAVSPDGQTLYPILEKPLVNACDRLLPIYRFDARQSRYTGIWAYYPMEASTTSVADFVLTTATRGLVIERDDREGDLGAIKRVYRLDWQGIGKPVKKTLVADLMAIADPQHLAGSPRPGDIGITSRFALPFFTIEGLLPLGQHELGIVTDNNYPFSTGRHPKPPRPDDTEFVRIGLSSPF
jgi:hypothetical protein